MINYIIIESTKMLTSQKRAEIISRELYNLITPVMLQQGYQKSRKLFPIIKHPEKDLYSLQVDLEYKIRIHDEANLEKLVSMFPDLTEQERIELQGFLHVNDYVLFKDIIPDATTIHSAEDMMAHGWFREE